MNQRVITDFAIIGGGIAGLWLLNRLHQAGYSAILVESNSLGFGQTNKSQGIIHGGMKFALQGSLTSAAQAIANMPNLWENCLQGKGEIDLSQVPILSQNQYLWSTGSLSSKLTGFFAGLTLKGRVKPVDKKNFPAIFQHPQFKGHLYSLNEIVIDVTALIRELAKPYQKRIFKIDTLNINDDHITLQTASRSVDIQAQKYIFTAGAENASLLKIPMQRRPLHMVIAKTDFSYPLYAHCLGLSSVPRITITTHTAQDGKTIWYLGGQLAEEGIHRSASEQIQVAQQELQTLFPWLNFSNVTFASFLIDRAEALQVDGKRPDSFYFKEIKNKITAWPTKLAFAPALANELIAHCKSLQPCAYDLNALQSWPAPDIAKPVWDELL